VVAMEDGELLRPGMVSVAPAGRQAVVDPGGRIALGPVRRCRADALFVSLARAFEERAIGVVLTGRLDDGAAGARAIKAHGGRVIAQDRRTSEQFGMPSAAIGTGCVDWVLPLDRIGHALVGLAMWPGAVELLRVPAPPWARLIP
jgi:two-component system, chemotaxis family, protein-glutamate methylesterase/glutaminase